MSGHHGVPTKLFMLILLLIAVKSFTNAIVKPKSGLLLFDFENATDLNNWQILTDTKRSNGMSKASFVLNKTSTKQSAVFYSSLLPHPKNRACFSGIITFLQINLHKYQYVYFNCLARGRSNNYKFSLGHNNLHYPIPSFDFYFKVNIDRETIVKLPLLNFKPYIGHRVLKDGPKLNFRNITSIGIQVTGILDRSVTKPFESTLTLYKMWIIPFMNNRNFMKNLTVKAV